MEQYSFKLEKTYENVYIYLKEKGYAENYIRNLRKQMGYIKINDIPATTKSHLNEGDILTLIANPNKKTTIMHCILALNIVYEDEYYLLINKPSGLSSMPSRSHYTENLSGAICYYMDSKDKNFTLRMINRLDKDTAGLILVAKDSIAQKEINFLQKKYVAICKGKLDKKLIIDSPIQTITKNGINKLSREINELGQPATTFVTPISFTDTASLVELELIHGRTHQIRVHLSSIGHPLIGDDIYGEKSQLIDHTALICNQFEFYHPFLNKILSFKIDYEDDFKKLIETLGLSNK